ncbi:ABC-three component system protein [Pseudomonas sp. 5FOS]|uniref:ABC-three component system protein n=1 Tax=unclassified Pseudomonas TaxID=196821 RepID=UPI002FE103B7
MDNTEASASIAGFGYQFERALYRIFHSSHQDALFGIETADDVEEVIPTATGTISIQEQDKLTLAAKNPLQDSSRNLWNTFKNWLDKLEQSQWSHQELLFLLVTNGSVSEGSLAHRLSAASSPESVAAVISHLRAQALTMTGAVAEIAAKVTAFDDESLAYVITRFELIHRLESDSITEAMYTALQFPEGLDDHKKIILDSLSGHLFNAAFDSWRRKQPFWTTSQPYFNLKQILFDKFLSEAWTPRKLEDTGYQALVELNRELQLPFIAQLKSLGIMERSIEKELGHYWGGYAERSRLLLKGKVLPEHFDDLEEMLRDRWDNLREVHSNEAEIPYEDFSKADHKKIYLATISPENFKIELGRLKSNHRYLYLGTYHHQVNDDGTNHPVHWHPTTGDKP